MPLPIFRSVQILLWAVSALALPAAVPAQQPAGIPIAADEDEATRARMIETADSIRIEITGPKFIVPLVGIDADGNGEADEGVDFLVSSAPDGSPCLSRLLGDGRSSPCAPPDGKAQLTKVPSGDTVATSFVFPKQAISADGLGFGFVIRLWNEDGHYATTLAAGDYRFGGALQLAPDGPNVLGGGSDMPRPVRPAIHRYQGCLNRGVRALGDLELAKLNAMKEVPAGCRAVRSVSADEAVAALVASGAQKPEALEEVHEILDQIDAGFARLVEVVEAQPPKN